jgi:hypothetical protein
MHQALDRSAKPETATSGGFNPLQRSPHKSSKHWWAIAGAALLASATVLILPRFEFTSEPVSPSGADAQMTGMASLTGEVEQARTSSDTNDTMIETPDEATQAVSSSSFTGKVETPVDTTNSGDKLTDSPDKRTESVETNTESLVDNNDATSQSLGATASVSGSPSADRDTPQPIATVEPSLATEPLAVTTTPTTPTTQSTVSTPAVPQATIVSAREEPAPNETEGLAITADNPSRVETQGQTSPAPVVVEPASSVARAIPRHSQARQAVQTAISQQNMEQAQALLATWIEREPTLEEPRLWLAKINLRNGRQRDAEALLIGLRSPEALGLRGLILEQTERFADAARVFESLTREDSGNPQWWLHWAINMENSGRIEEAQLLYQTYLQQFSSHNARLTAFASDRYRALARL